MKHLYAQWMARWERKLATRDTNRVVRPFDWGTDWLNTCDFPGCPPGVNCDSGGRVSPLVTRSLTESGGFVVYLPVTAYRLRDSRRALAGPMVERYLKKS